MEEEKLYPIIDGDWYVELAEQIEKNTPYKMDEEGKYVTLDNGDIWRLTKKEINESRKKHGSDFEYNRHFKTYIQYS